MAKLSDILKQREQQYGSYPEKATQIQVMKDIMRNSKNWDAMPPCMQESLDMIISKIGRVLNGDITHVDNFKDIAGYAQLVCDELEKEKEKENSEEHINKAMFIFDGAPTQDELDAAVSELLKELG